MRSEAPCKINTIRVSRLTLTTSVLGPSLSCEFGLLNEGKEEEKGAGVTMGTAALGHGLAWPEPVLKAAASLVKEIETFLLEIYFGEKRSETEQSKPRGIVFNKDSDLEGEQL